MFSSALMVRSLIVFGVLASFGYAASPLYNFPTSLPKGFFMKYRVKQSQFVPSRSSNKDLEVSFNFSTECDYPELPSWLHLEQRRASAPAYFYGSPGNWDKSTKLEVIGWDKDSYSTERKIQDLIISGDSFPWFQAEFFIKNKTLDAFLHDGEDKKIVDIVRNYWSPVDLGLTMVVSAIGRGGRVPLPDSNNHEGVIVRVGSSEMWPGDNGTLRAGEEPSDDYFKDKGFEIDWSRFTWIDLRTMKDPDAERQVLLPPDSIVKEVSYTPPEFDDSARDFDLDFILVIIIPLIIILIFVLILSLIMCFGREGRRKRDQQTPHMKLTHHHNIQRSTLRLRELSKPREQDQSPKSFPSENPAHPSHTHGDYERLDDDADDDRTDGRNAPPPYRMPPGSAGRGTAQQV